MFQRPNCQFSLYLSDKLWFFVIWKKIVENGNNSLNVYWDVGGLPNLVDQLIVDRIVGAWNTSGNSVEQLSFVTNI